MQIPADMHKWRTKLAWQMIGCVVLLLLLAGVGGFQIWFFRAKFLAKPIDLLIPTVGLAFGVIAAIWAAFMCIKISIIARKSGVKMREMEKNRPPLTLSKLREELQPEKLEQSRTSMLRMLQAMPPETRVYTEAKLKELVDRYRAGLGSTPEAEMAKPRPLFSLLLPPSHDGVTHLRDPCHLAHVMDAHHVRAARDAEGDRGRRALFAVVRVVRA